MNKLFLVDAYSIIYRAYYALMRSPRINSKHFNTSAVYGFAEILAKTAVDGLNENALEMRFLAENFVEIVQDSAGKLVGKSFCFTGELHSMKRNDAEALVKANGGTCKSSVTKDLSYLVTNDVSSGSSKNQKAVKFGIPVINEEQFIKMLE